MMLVTFLCLGGTLEHQICPKALKMSPRGPLEVNIEHSWSLFRSSWAHLDLAHLSVVFVPRFFCSGAENGLAKGREGFKRFLEADAEAEAEAAAEAEAEEEEEEEEEEADEEEEGEGRREEGR